MSSATAAAVLAAPSSPRANGSVASHVTPVYDRPDWFGNKRDADLIVDSVVSVTVAAFERAGLSGKLRIKFTREVKRPIATSGEVAFRPLSVSAGSICCRINVAGVKSGTISTIVYVRLDGQDAHAALNTLLQGGTAFGQALVANCAKSAAAAKGRSAPSGSTLLRLVEVAASDSRSAEGPAEEESASLHGFTAREENVQLLVLGLIEKMGSRTVRRASGELRDVVKEVLEGLNSTLPVSNGSAGQILGTLIERNLLAKATHPSEKTWRDAEEPYRLSEGAYRLVGQEPPGFPPMPVPKLAAAMAPEPPPVVPPAATAPPPPVAKPTEPPPTSSAGDVAPATPPPLAQPAAPPANPPSGLSKIEAKLAQFRGAQARNDEIEIRLAAIKEEQAKLEAERTANQALLEDVFLKQLAKLAE